MLLVCAWARSKPALMFSWRLHVNGPCYAPNTGHGSPCNTCTVTLGIWIMNVPIVPLHLVHLGSFPATALPLAGFVITLTHLPILVTVTASARLELKQHRYLRMGVSAVFLIGFFVTLTHAFASLVVLLSAFFSAHPLYSSGKVMESPTSSVSTASSFGENFAHNMWNPLLELLCHEQTSGVFVLYVEDTDLAQIAPSCHFALDFLCYKEGAYDSVWCFIGHLCLRKRVFCFWHDTIVTVVGSKPWILATWSSFAAQSERSSHGSGITGYRYKESVFVADLNCLASLYVGSRLYMVLAGVTLWSVTNPLTLFGIRFS